MSAKSKNSKALNRPFAPDIQAAARRIAKGYRIVLEQADGEYFGHALELPGARDDGRTPDECVEKTRRAAEAIVACLLEEGQVPPTPSRPARRTEQVNVRLSVEEKLAIEAAARQKGFKGLGDYLRAAAMA